MEYLEIIRRIRRILFSAFLINLFLVVFSWLFVLSGWAEYITWALPGFSAESVNTYMLWAIGIMDTAGCVLFLVPTIALSVEIPCARRRQKREEEEFERLREYIFNNEEQIYADAGIEPYASRAKAKRKTKPARNKTK